MSSQKFVSSPSGNMYVVTTNSTAANQSRQQSAISYILYLHREELRKRKASCMRISHTKFQLTHELIVKTVRNIHKCSADDLQILNRETVFKKNLYRQIARMRHFQHIQLIRHQQQQKEKFQKQQGQQQYKQNSGVTGMEGIETSRKS